MSARFRRSITAFLEELSCQWLFFDVGSTLINEEKAYEHRMRDMAGAANKSYEEIYELAINFYKENKKGDLEVTKLLGLPKQKWYFEDEVLYKETMHEKAFNSLSSTMKWSNAAMTQEFRESFDKTNY